MPLAQSVSIAYRAVGFFGAGIFEHRPARLGSILRGRRRSPGWEVRQRHGDGEKETPIRTNAGPAGAVRYQGHDGTLKDIRTPQLKEAVARDSLNPRRRWNNPARAMAGIEQNLVS